MATVDNPTDLKISKPFNKPYYDIALASDGDFELVEGLSTAIQMSFFGEPRANESESPSPEQRRGWWGNELNRNEGYEIGSKLWLLHQARNTQETLNFAINYVRQGFAWFIEDELAKNVEVTATRVLEDNNIDMNISIFRSNDEILSARFQLWERTNIDNI